MAEKTDPDANILAHTDESIPQCCCGRDDCAFRLHSSNLIQKVERDARTAGALGQALLVRHESYVASAEADRKQLLAKMEQLELEKRTLEYKNQVTIEENRKLLDQLESLNSAVADSESHAKSLTETLHSTEQELESLQGLIAHTERLQRQLTRLEEEQELLHGQMGKTKEDERAAWLRYQQAQRTILSLHVQIEEIEREAKEERERHGDLLERIDRRRAVETELRASAARLNGAPKNGASGTVVSHFVRDVLQDNANMQLGIMELRELLQRSNDEVEKLREQINECSPTAATTVTPQPSPRPDLSLELGSKELHVHHHYHAPSPTAEPATKTLRGNIRRVPRRRRTQMPHTPMSGSQTPRSSVGSIGRPTSPTSTSTILSQTTVTVPHQRLAAQRWSMQSAQTGVTTSSSLPSSPYGESIFDRAYGGTNTDLSRPTSPESNGVFSPRRTSNSSFMNWNERVKHGRHASESTPAVESLIGSQMDEAASIAELVDDPSRRSNRASMLGTLEQPMAAAQTTILEENEDQFRTSLENSSQTAEVEQEHIAEPPEPPFDPSPTLHRDRRGSMLSISGMDIHTLSIRPSQIFLGGGSDRRNFSAPIVVAPSTTLTSAVLCDASATAIRPRLYRKGRENEGASFSRSYLSSLAREEQGRRTLNKKPSRGILDAGKSLGGWVFGKWGVAAADSDPSALLTRSAPEGQRPRPNVMTANSTDVIPSTSAPPIAITSPAISRLKSKASLASSLGPASASGSTFTSAVTIPPKPRPPGVNQSGPIFGFGPEPPTPYKSSVAAADVDIGALREGLEE